MSSDAKSRRYHNRVAKKYDAMYDDAYWRFHDEITWQAVKPHLPTNANARCLDLGCGTGKWGLKLLKSGYPTTFVDHAPAMIGEVRGKLDELGSRAAGCEAIVADIVDLSALPTNAFALTVAMGDPLSICSDATRAAAEMARVCAPGGVVIATADNKLAAAEAYLLRGDTDGMERVLKTGKTRWVTGSASEQFELTTFTPGELRKLFEKMGFEVLGVWGKTVLPVRQQRELLAEPEIYRKWLAAELRLGKDEAHAARAGHLQIIARRPG